MASSRPATNDTEKSQLAVWNLRIEQKYPPATTTIDACRLANAAPRVYDPESDFGSITAPPYTRTAMRGTVMRTDIREAIYGLGTPSTCVSGASGRKVVEI